LPKTIVIVFAIAAFASVARAQVPSGNIFVGYSYSRADAGLIPTNQGGEGLSFNGWEGAVEGKFLPWIGIVADVGGLYGPWSRSIAVTCPISLPSCAVSSVSARVHTVLFGPRVSISVGKFTPFVHALVGVGHVSKASNSFSASDTSFATAIGGGLDYKLIKGLAWRVQGDALSTHLFNNSQNNFRFSTGIVFRF
jgi:opacity protein-like surface antigen